VTGGEVPQDKTDAPLPEIEGGSQERPEKRHSQWASRDGRPPSMPPPTVMLQSGHTRKEGESSHWVQGLPGQSSPLTADRLAGRCSSSQATPAAQRGSLHQENIQKLNNC